MIGNELSSVPEDSSPWLENAERHFRLVSKLETIREKYAYYDGGMGVPLVEAKETHQKMINRLESLRGDAASKVFSQSTAFYQGAQGASVTAQSAGRPESGARPVQNAGKKKNVVTVRRKSYGNQRHRKVLTGS